ncbi:MAG: divalent metal cation transporter [Pseudomonadales bacterium]|jgi:manganese transport protein|nr:divalent metal cation transporter [Pseudomonadales bacterium]
MSTIRGHVRAGGPGWLQGAMTLGGGSAITSLTLGIAFGYEFLWLQPIAMLVGCVMLFALSHQTLSTGERPFYAMRNHVSEQLAWFWAIAALASSIIWGFSHYPLSAGMLEEAISVTTGFDLKGEGETTQREIYLFVLAVAVWTVCAYTVWQYNQGGRAVRLFENGIKILSTVVVISFAWVVLQAGLQGQINWAAVLWGLIPHSLPDDTFGVTTLMAALGTAVGINMTFVYGYTLLNRGWGRGERALSRYDIMLGLVIPYLLVTTLISLAAAGSLYGVEGTVQSRLSPHLAGAMFADAGLGDFAGRLVFPVGVLGMAVGSLVMHMLTCGAAAKEMFGLADDSLAHRLCCLLPTPAVLGVFVWTTMGPYVILPTSAICGLLLPIAYIGWLVLNNRKEYLGDDMPRGARRTAYNGAMVLCIVTVLASVAYSTLISLGWI